MQPDNSIPDNPETIHSSNIITLVTQYNANQEWRRQILDRTSEVFNSVCTSFLSFFLVSIFCVHVCAHACVCMYIYVGREV
jgi:hypothetical protein